MPEAAGDYVPVAIHQRMLALAWRSWAVLLAVAGLWTFLILLPALLAGNDMASTAAPLYKFFSFICHQKPERSLHLLEHQLGVCSRCFGVYLGILIGVIAYPFWRAIDEIEPLPRFWLFLSLVPIGIDWTLGVTGVWENNHFSRLITGLILGFTCATYIVPAVVEITRYLARASFQNIR